MQEKFIINIHHSVFDRA